jgi:prepilin-type processing-associated H-X9-DG protein
VGPIGESTFGPNGGYLVSIDRSDQNHVAHLQDQLYADIAHLRPSRFKSLHGDWVNCLFLDGHATTLRIHDD